jgi:hypothetical protein
MRIFGADKFRRFSNAEPIKSGPISYGRGPRHREHAFIIDREFEL